MIFFILVLENLSFFGNLNSLKKINSFIHFLALSGLRYFPVFDPFFELLLIKTGCFSGSA